MIMTTVTITRRAVTFYWRERRPFRLTSGNLRGIEGAYEDTGWMPEPYRTEYREDRRADRVAYTVVSYATPIAWVLTDGTVKRPDTRYSPTTSCHQGKLY